MKKRCLAACLPIVAAITINAHQTEFPKLTGPYLGQKPPGMTPEIFAPGIVSTGMSESALAVAPDGKEIFFTVHAGNSETIITTRFENGCWTALEVAPFSGKYLDGFPAMHPDGSKLFFHSYRPLDKGSQISDVVNIWFVEKKGAGWSEPKPIGPPVNGNGFVCCPSVTKTGTLYYSRKTRDGGERIYRSRFVNGKYMEPEELPQQVNREKEQYHAVISPDESYLILPRDNYLVSFRDEHDQWSDLIPLGDVVNKMRSGGCPSISSDGRYFFFSAYPQAKWNKYFKKRHTYKDLQEITLQHPVPERTDIFWVDAKIIEALRPKKSDIPILTGPYLGQKPPGMTPEAFAPGVVSTDRIEFGNAFSPDGGEFYFTQFIGEKNLAAILFVKMANGRWSGPQVVPFSGTYSDVDPVFSPDGTRLFYSSNRPLNGAGTAKADYDIWFVNRTESGWSEPVNPGSPVNSTKDEFAPSLARDGAIYFASNREGGLGQMDFYCSRWKEGKYGKPENLGEAINTKYREGDGFISPDGKAFIFSAFIPGNSGSGDLYVSRQDGTGEWTQAENLGSGISSEGNEFTPVVTADGKYLFFASDRTGNEEIYWVDMESVDKTAADHFIVQKATLKKDVSSALPRLYIMGGFNEKETYSEVYSISLPDFANGENEKWNRGPSLPKALQGHAAVAIRNRIFVLGGLEGFAENRRAIYSPDAFSAEIKGAGIGEWKNVKPFPHPLGYHSAVTYRDFIIVSGGQSPADVSGVYQTSIAINGEAGDWERAGDLPKAMRGHASVVVNDRLFIFGGHDDNEFFADVFSAPVDAEGKIGKWEYATPLPLPLVHSGVAAHKGRVYIIGGQDAKDNLHAEIYSAEVAGAKLGIWRRETPFPVPQSRMTVHVVDGQFIVTGGGFGWAPPVYSAIFASGIGGGGRLGKWRKIGDLPGPLAFHAAIICQEKQHR